MRKIPTLLVRDPDDRAHVTDEVTPGCEWVLAGEGVATRKYDGTCVMRDDDSRWWARREVKPARPAPDGFVPVEHDTTTGKTFGWEPIEQSPFHRFWREAYLAMPMPRMPGTYELIGPRINGNPERRASHVLVRHADAERVGLGTLVPRDARGAIDLVAQYADELGWEGVVWHHLDGRMAKLKARDLGPTADARVTRLHAGQETGDA